MAKYYYRSTENGKRKVLVKDVPKNAYSIGLEDNFIDCDFDIWTHNNSEARLTKKEIKKQFNLFTTKKEAQEARRKIIRALKGKNE